MTQGSAEEAARKADRALELFEQGIKPAVIAERLGVRPTHVGGMLQRARQRREKLQQETAE
jgi:DNA-binding transcriptional regulator LsrR (DeoR family)